MKAKISSLPVAVEKEGEVIVLLALVSSFETVASAVIGGLGTVTATPADGVSRLALSSTARLRTLIDPALRGVQEYDQVDSPVAGCQVCPPSVETSTPATTPPPTSTAVPVTVTVMPN